MIPPVSRACADCFLVQTKDTNASTIDILYLIRYNMYMIEIRETAVYKKWFEALKDKKAKARIDVRIRRISLGNFGDVKPVGKGISELKIDYGPGYRVYFMKQENIIVILLCGGDKSTQPKDIQKAQDLVRLLKEQTE